MRNVIFYLVITLVFLSSLLGCSDGKNTLSIEGNTISLKYSRLLEMKEFKEGITLVDIRNPWDTTSFLDKYALVRKGLETDGIPENYTVIQIPIDRSVVYSGVHTSLLRELGALESIVGVCDTAYLSDPETEVKVKEGKIQCCGQSFSPTLEKIITLKPEIVLLSPYQNSNEAARYRTLGIKVIQAADYMEPSPLARAEWMKFFGLLYGQEERSDSLFNEIDERYNGLRLKAQQVKYKPVVIFDRIYNGVWYIPTNTSVTGNLIKDAGGINPFEKYKGGGSIGLSAEEVLYTAKESDIWLIRHSEENITSESLLSDNPIYSQFRPFKVGSIYEANTLTTHLLEEGAFHPECILAEMTSILHPELQISSLKYYKRLR